MESPHLKLLTLPFTQDILAQGGMLHVVGGSCRDFLINLHHNTCYDSKDLDILVTKIEVDDLTGILDKYGRIDLVGKDFGIIKFKAFGSDEELDISLPRTEESTGDRGHKSFKVTSNPFLPIEVEMRRRDLKINAISIDVHGNIFDPFNGIRDIKNKEINVTDEKTFLEDPLRLLRAIMFSSRFKFMLTEKTLNLIKENAHKIDEISPERILIELEKMALKGDPLIAFNLFNETGLYEVIFGKKLNYNSFSICELRKIKTMGEFIFLLTNKIDSSKIYKKILKGDTDTYNEIRALEKLFQTTIHSSYHQIKNCIFEALNIYPKVINTEIFNESPHFKYCIEPFKNGTYPKSLKELAVNGFDLMELLYTGIEIKQVQYDILYNIFNGSLKNDKEEILNCLKRKIEDEAIARFND